MEERRKASYEPLEAWLPLSVLLLLALNPSSRACILRESEFIQLLAEVLQRGEATLKFEDYAPKVRIF